MLVGEIGEFQLIEALRAIVDGQAAKAAEGPERQELLLSIGDDASAWQPPATTEVHTTDTLVEGVHFTLEHTSWRDLGWKALAVNLSDIAAMGCAPHHSLVTLGLRADLPVEGIREMYRGMVEASSRYGGGIAGGDIVRSPTLFVSVTMNGYACRPDGADEGEAPLLRRDRAAPGDLIAVTGHLGSSAGGLRALSGADGASVDDETSAHLRDAHNRPTPRVSEGLALVRAGVAAAMDISDGLVDDLGKMCAASGVGAVVRAERVPTDRSLRRAYPHEYLELALTGGEDYELLFTATRPVMEAAASALDTPVTTIGEIVDGPPEVRVLDAAGEPWPVETGGWDHFRQSGVGAEPAASDASRTD